MNDEESPSAAVPSQNITPWLKLYPAVLPQRIDADYQTMLDMLYSSVQSHPNTPILRYFDGTIRLRQLDCYANALAAYLQRQGFVPGDRIALYTQNNPAFVIGLLAAWKAGGIAVLVNPMNKSRELRYLLQDSGACALLCLDYLYQEVAAEVMGNGDTAVKIVITSSALDWQNRNDRRVLDQEKRLPVPEGIGDLLAICQETQYPAAVPQPQANDVAVLAYTSGTTGKAKGVMNTHGNLAFNAQTYRDWIKLSTDDVILAIAPLFHITGLVGHVALSLLLPCPLVLSHRFHPEVMLDTIRQHQPSFTIGAITAFVSLVHHPSARREDFASLRKIYSGGAPIAPATSAFFEEFSGHYIHNAFGMTETCSPTHFVPLGQRAPVDPQSGALSIGIPVFNTMVRILDDTGQVLPTGEIGEIVSSGPQVMLGYWKLPEATAEAMPDGQLRTGDVGFMDENGWFYLVDRKKDMINAGGYKVWPREVEDVLYSHPAVREAAVVGVPDDYRGETVKAVVSIKPGQQVSAVELTNFCRTQMAAYKYPRIIEFVDELPKTVTGKILRRELR